MSAHTPGPWLLRTAPTSAGLCHIVSAAGWRGAFLYGDGIRPGVDDAMQKAQELAANARLIAAAPDLLEALENLLAVVNVRIDDPRTAQFDAARKAIAKSKGDES